MRLSPKLLTWHPILFGVLPALHLFAGNVHLWPLNLLYRPLVLLVALSTLLWLLVARWWRSSSRAAPFVSLLLMYVFTYERVVNVLGPVVESPWSQIAGWLYLGAGLWFFLWLGRRLRRGRGELSLANQVLTAMAGVLLVTPLYVIPSYWMQQYREAERLRYAVPQLTATDQEQLPDIYHIILDGYGRSDVLQEIYQHDNRPFLGRLSEMGFYVADRSRANYIQTLLSLSSSLNLDYLDKLNARSDDHRMILNQLLDRSAALEALRNNGYRTYLLPARYPMASLSEFDVIRYDPLSLNEFTYALFRSTPLIWLTRAWGELGHMADPDLASHRRQIMATFKNLQEFAPGSNPSYVMAHLLVPHPPFTFDENGGVVNKQSILHIEDGSHFHNQEPGSVDSYVDGYRRQAVYAEREVLKALESILSRAQRPTVIILQGDHGPASGLNWEDIDDSNLNERTAILNAYYFSDGNYDSLSPQISPVNTYRVIFNRYFGAQLPLLENRFYYSPWSRPYDFTNITDRLRSLEVAAE